MNGILIIDKRQDWTSHDIVAKSRGILRTRAIGHAGTLDPLATGVLPLLVGSATKALDYLPSGKHYIATMRLGITTDTQDITGNVTSTSDALPPYDAVQNVLPEFTGAQQQIPPMYSAVKIDGKKLYDIARKGGEIERPPRDIMIKKLELLSQSDNDYVIEVHCSGGTYIRTLCHDIGQKLGCGAVMTALRRTMACNFTLDNAVTLDDLQNGNVPLIDTDTIFADHPMITATDEEIAKICNGQAIANPRRCGTKGKESKFVRVYTPNGQFFMLGCIDDGMIKQVKRFM